MSNTSSTELARRALLPWWLRLLSWLCLLFLAIVPLFVLVTLFADQVTVNVPGRSYTGSPISPPALFMDAFLLMHGVAAYGLLWGKRWGPAVAVTLCGTGLALYLYAFVESGFSGQGAAPIVWAIVLVSLVRLEKRWTEATGVGVA
jgi:hypothetical protein